MLPTCIDPELWEAFCEMRHEMGKRAPFTEAAKRLTIKKLLQFEAEGYDANSALEQSIMRGWRGVFQAELKTVTRKQVDPALQKIADDSKKATPMPDHIKAQLAALKRGQLA